MRRFLTRMVAPKQWDLSRLDDPIRQRRLLDAPTPDELLARVLAEAKQSARSNITFAKLAAIGCDARTFSPLREDSAQQGNVRPVVQRRSGYRAQYYLSPEEGVLFNRRILDGMVEAIRFAYRLKPLAVTFDAIEQSLYAPHSKIWIYGEQDAFDEATPDLLNPQRWLENGATRGRRIPLPIDHAMDLKGAFIHEKQETFSLIL